MKEEEDDKRVDFVKWFSELSNKDVAIAGGKGASLAEMYNYKFPIPPGFSITAQSYSYFILKAGLSKRIKDILDHLNIENTEELNKASKKIRELIVNADMPKEMEEAIMEAYDLLDIEKQNLSMAKGSALDILKNSHEPPFVAVRSSATTEDLKDASFAGQQESFLNVKGHKQLIQKVKECFASLFTSRAIYYRTKKGFPHEKSYLSVVVQKMINSEKSGVIFSINPITGEENVLLEAVWGLGEGIVSGRIKPDQYIVSGDEFKILDVKISEKKSAIVRDSSGNNLIIDLNEEKRNRQVLTNYEIKTLAQYAKKLEEHYKHPQDIEFAIEGGNIYIVQSRPVTTKPKEAKEEISGNVLLSGFGASPGIASGSVKIVHKMEDLDKIRSGDILVTEMTNPDMVVTMQKSSGIVTDEGGLTSHAAIVSREMGIPAVVGTGDATKKLHDGMIITVDGNTGRVIEGKGKTELAEIKTIVQTRTKIKVIVDLPDFAERAAKSGAEGVGLTRIEGIIAGSGKHPIAYVKENKVEDYIKILKRGLGKIAKPFKEIWIRTSDIRSDEFRNLEGSSKEVEGNPMLGDHGIRYSLKNREVIRAELKAVKELAEEFPDKIFGIMVPQLISLEELQETRKEENEIGMPKNVKIGIMVETPAAVQIIESLCKEGINFISFGTNDLTQYTLAIDRNNSEVQDLYNEMHPAVLSSISHVIRVCRKYGVETSICGQAGSREEMAEFLLKEGISSISVNADAAHKISSFVAKLEENKVYEAKEKNYKNTAGGSIVKHEAPIKSAGISNLPRKLNENTDIEDIMLKELEETSDVKEDYLPDHHGDYKIDIPRLNDSIPIESEHFDESDKIKEDIRRMF